MGGGGGGGVVFSICEITEISVEIINEISKTRKTGAVSPAHLPSVVFIFNIFSFTMFPCSFFYLTSCVLFEIDIIGTVHFVSKFCMS